MKIEVELIKAENVSLWNKARETITEDYQMLYEQDNRTKAGV